NFQKCIAQPRMKSGVKLLKAVFGFAARLRAHESRPRFDINNDGQIWFECSGCSLQRPNAWRAETARDTLIHHGRINKTVADHPVASAQCGFDHPRDMIGACGKKQQCLHKWRPAFGFALDQQLADLFRAGRSAGFSRENGFASAGSQPVRQAPCLRGFARALPTFEGDEAAARGWVHAFAPKTSTCKPVIIRSRKPFAGTPSAAMAGTTLSGFPGTDTVMVPICCPAATGAWIGPS